MQKVSLQKATAYETITQGYLLAMCTVFLLFAGVQGYARISDEKAWLFYALSAGYLTVLLGYRLGLCLVGRGKVPCFRRVWGKVSVAQMLMVAFWLMSLVSALLSRTPKNAFFGNLRHEGWVTLTLYVGCFLAVARWGRPSGRLLAVFAAAMSINCVVALLQLLGGNPFGLFPEGMNYYDAYVKYNGQFLGTIGNVDLLSAVLCLAVPVFWLSLWKGKTPARFLLLLPLSLCLLVLFWAFVEGGILGVCVSILLTVPLLFSKKKARKIALWAVLVLLLAAAAAVYALGEKMGGFLYEASELMHGKARDHFGSGRIYIWKNVLRLIPQRLWFGGGPDTLGLQSEILFSRYDEVLGKTTQISVDTAHNEYLNILVNQGFSSLLPHFAALGIMAVRWLKKAPYSPQVLILGGGVLGYCVQAFFGISTPTSAAFFWLALGLLENALRRAEE